MPFAKQGNAVAITNAALNVTGTVDASGSQVKAQLNDPNSSVSAGNLNAPGSLSASIDCIDALSLTLVFNPTVNAATAGYEIVVRFADSIGTIIWQEVFEFYGGATTTYLQLPIVGRFCTIFYNAITGVGNPGSINWISSLSSRTIASKRIWDDSAPNGFPDGILADLGTTVTHATTTTRKFCSIGIGEAQLVFRCNAGGPFIFTFGWGAAPKSQWNMQQSASPNSDAYWTVKLPNRFMSFTVQNTNATIDGNYAVKLWVPTS